MGTDLTPAPLTATGLFVRVLADADGRTVIALDPAATVALAAILDAVPVTTVLTDLGLDPATALTAADVVTALTAGLAPPTCTATSGERQLRVGDAVPAL